MRVLVTGASGFIGGHLVAELLRRDHEVVALARRPLAVPVELVVEQDLTRPLEHAAFPALDAVVHLAQANVPFPDGARELFRVNAASTVELLELARARGAGRFVLASSGSIYGLGEGSVTEKTARRAGDFYAVTKRAAEAAVEAYAPFLSTSILRLFTPYGPGQHGRLVPRLIERVRDGRPVTLHAGGRPRLSPIYVGDVVRVLALAAAGDGAEVVNVAGDEHVSIRELAARIGEAVGREPLFEEMDAPVEGDLTAVNARLKEAYGIDSLVPLADGLRETVRETAPV